ncbi:uncharacterized protein VTP21DRAFT_11199 [Calcarisporiella thermophila]|uniref:uncharacterized protein n=1 Tax=Calcarisporiella thermophila TaxID=911321 RepID=UPI0037425A7A
MSEATEKKSPTQPQQGADDFEIPVSKTREEVYQFLESLDFSHDESRDVDAKDGGDQHPQADPNEILSFLDELDSSTMPADKVREDKQAAASAAAEAMDEKRLLKEEEYRRLEGKEKEAGGNGTEEISTGKRKDGRTNSTSWLSWGTSVLGEAFKHTTNAVEKGFSEGGAARLLEERLGSIVSKDSIGKLGTNIHKITSELIETIAPPISDHEVIQVWLAHDMVGYIGVEALVYREFSRVLEMSLEDSNVVIRKGNSRTVEREVEDDAERQLNACDGFAEAIKLAQANVDYLVKTHGESSNPPEHPRDVPSGEVSAGEQDPYAKLPIHRCPVFIALQPCYTTPSGLEGEASQLLFCVLLVDTVHSIRLCCYSQSIPSSWLLIPYESNEWVEDKMVECMRLAVQTIALDYVYERMKLGSLAATVAGYETREKEEVEKKKVVEKEEPSEKKEDVEKKDPEKKEPEKKEEVEQIQGAKRKEGAGKKGGAEKGEVVEKKEGVGKKAGGEKRVEAKKKAKK